MAGSEVTRESFNRVPVARSFDEHLFLIENKPYFELPEGSKRPTQMLVSNLIRDLIPTAAEIVAATKDGRGAACFFSRYRDVTDPEAPAWPISTIQAEYVFLREIMLCKDRGFQARMDYRYTSRKPGVLGHNMDWIMKDPGRGLISARHYDFEKFFTFLTGMEALWVKKKPADDMRKLKEEYEERLTNYITQFASRDFLGSLISLLKSMQTTLTFDRVKAAVDSMHAQQEKPDPKILHEALQNKMVFFLKVLTDYKSSTEHA